MITITKQTNGVLFTFENSDKYLYGDGSILTPFNSLSVIQDESDIITLKKAASNDVFIAARYDTDFGYESKDAAISDLKSKLFAEGGGGSGSGVTPSEVQTMIDQSISGLSSDVETLSGDVEMKQDALEFYTEEDTEDVEKYGQIETADDGANNGAHVFVQYYHEGGDNQPYASLDAWTNDGEGNEKQNRVYADADGVAILADENADDGEGNIVYTTANVSVTSTEIGMSVTEEGESPNTLSITSTDVTINGDAIATEPYVDAAVSGKADTSAVTAISDSLTGKVDTTAITTSITSGSTDSEIPSAKAVFDAIPTGGTGGMDDDMEKLISSSLNDLNDRKIDASEVMTKYQRKGDYATNTALALKANSADVMTLTKSEENEFVAASALVDLNNKFGGLSLVKITESDYAALTTKDDNTLYIVVADPT